MIASWRGSDYVMDKAVQHKLSLDVYKSEENLKETLAMYELIASDPVLKFKPSELGIDRVELFNINLARMLHLYKKVGRPLNIVEETAGLNSFPEQMAFGLHWKLFIPTLQNLCNEKQVDMFLKPALRMQIFGCYAQTELGHGSDVQGLETTAVYDPQHQQFVLHSPSVSSTKWWIGEAGLIANHAVVFAQLIIKQKRFGVQAFMVRLRNEGHKPLPGIQVGEQGAKYGFVNKDNGYIRFDRVRIPRQNMLMKYAKVSKTGQFSRTGDMRISYATMLVTRVFLAERSFFSLSKVATIATRFSHFRKQFREGERDIPVIEYQLQREKIYPAIADSFAYLYGSRRLDAECRKNVQLINEQNDFRLLNDCHAHSCGVKAVYTWGTYFSIQKLRRSLGGHGFSMYCGIPSIQSEFSPSPTFQGDNTVLMMQLGRYLLKSYDRALKAKPISDSVNYLTKEPVPVVSSKASFLDSNVVLELLAAEAYHRVSRAGMKLAEMAGQGVKQIDAWNKHAGIRIVEAAFAHIHHWTFSAFKHRVDSETHPQTKEVLGVLLALYGTNLLLSSAPGTKSMRGREMGWLQEVREQLLQRMQPWDLDLVGSFHYGVNQLFSAFAQNDGKGYQRLLQWAREQNPLNKEETYRRLRSALKDQLGSFSFRSTL